ncbi:hypothetical protein BVRB_2g037760 [Beta vulgaris subsp. vulgaris]|nr:hypothetical protein BVRB_2g037760 [Beta vulgaris subsp. vulgaris]
MPLMNRPRVVIDGVRRTRTYRFFWCRHCDRTVRTTSASSNPQNNFSCPLCHHFLYQEFHIPRPSNNFSFTSTSAGQSPSSSSSAAQLLDTMAQIINLPPHHPTMRPQLPFNSPASPPLQTPSLQDHTSDIRLTADMLCTDSTCSICKEDFVIDEKITKLGCNHFYHSDCITPWLRINNTCPVCRYQLPIQQGFNDDESFSSHIRGANYGNGYDNDDDYDFRLEDVMNLSWPNWAELLSLLRPFRLSSLLDWSL